MKDILKINTTALAFMGDAAYETAVREHLLKKGKQRPDVLHREAVRYVSAPAQAAVIKEMMDELTDDDKALEYENASPVSERIAAAEKLQEMGFDVSIRLSPFIPEYVDFDRLNAIKCDKIVVEFLRSNAFIRKSFPIDYSEYTVKSGGYRHLPLEKKKALISMITRFKEVTVCEDEPEAYEYWKHHFNPDPDDCCNLRKGMSICRRAQ